MNSLNLFTRDPYHRFRNLLVLSLYLPCPSTAAPVRDSSPPSNWLACLTALLIFSAACLSAFKFLFVRHRRTSNLKGSRSALVEGQCVHWILKIFKLPACITCQSNKRCKAGFLIGLFGSPSFEVQPKPSEITLIYPGIDTSRDSQSRDFSGDSSTTYKSKGSAYSSGPIFLFDEKHPCYNRGQDKKLSSLSVSSTKPAKSRTLLPTQLSFDLGRLRRKKLVQTYIPPPAEALLWPHNRLEHATLRLVKLYTEPEAVFPLCRNVECVPGYSSSASSAHSFAVAHLNQPHSLTISPLPSLPTEGPGNEQTGNASPPRLVGDHCYNNALLDLVKPGRQNTRRASLSPNLSVIEETCHSCPSAAALDQPKTLETSGQIKETIAYENVMKTPPVTYKVYDALKKREKLRSPLLRNRRSPPLGPSPLRSMILPEMAEENTPGPGSPIVDGTKYCATQRRSIQYRQIGLGLPSIKLSPPTKARIQSRDLTDSSSEDRESVLDFLRELAEETKEWDESIVLDEGFRNMIQRSEAVFGCATLEGSNKYLTPIMSGTSGTNITPPRLVSIWIDNSPTS